jgi:PTH1 family peptidyl-tRNA hydrolase
MTIIRNFGSKNKFVKNVQQNLVLLDIFVYNIKMFYIIGLGNPGDKYEKTRHNVGRMVLNEIVGDSWEKSKNANALYSRAMIASEAVEYLVPETFMNRSGETVKYIVDKQNAKPEEFIVVHDDIDLPFGEIKIVQGRGAGGNNGIDSIIKNLKSKNFIRVRVGIAPKSFWTGEMKRPAGGGPLERFVLKPFGSAEKKQLPEVQNKVREAIEFIVSEGVESAMNNIN